MFSEAHTRPDHIKCCASEAHIGMVAVPINPTAQIYLAMATTIGRHRQILSGGRHVFAGSFVPAHD